MQIEMARNPEPNVSYLNKIQSVHPKVAHIARLILNAKIHGLGDEYFRLG
jgi:hypothetical protein